MPRKRVQNTQATATLNVQRTQPRLAFSHETVGPLVIAAWERRTPRHDPEAGTIACGACGHLLRIGGWELHFCEAQVRWMKLQGAG